MLKYDRSEHMKNGICASVCLGEESGGNHCRHKIIDGGQSGEHIFPMFLLLKHLSDI